MLTNKLTQALNMQTDLATLQDLLTQIRQVDKFSAIDAISNLDCAINGVASFVNNKIDSNYFQTWCQLYESAIEKSLVVTKRKHLYYKVVAEILQSATEDTIYKLSHLVLIKRLLAQNAPTPIYIMGKVDLFECNVDQRTISFLEVDNKHKVFTLFSNVEAKLGHFYYQIFDENVQGVNVSQQIFEIIVAGLLYKGYKQLEAN